MTFAQISAWLNKRDYETPRGKAFGPNHVFSIYKKKRLRDKRIMGPENPMIKHIEINVAEQN